VPDPSFESSSQRVIELEQQRLPSGRGNRTDNFRAGISLSGGGIRSATFNLGILQELERLGLLKYFDYLSTVSGGGYIGSWFAACRKNDVPLARWCNFGGQRIENEAFHHLRSYSRYLTPQGGFLSIDTLTTVGIVLRNMLLNQGVLVTFLSLVLMVPLWVEKFFRVTGSADCAPAFLVFFSFGLMAAGIVRASLWLCRVDTAGSPGPWAVTSQMVVPISVASLLFAATFSQHRDYLVSNDWLEWVAPAVFFAGTLAVVWTSMASEVAGRKKVGVGLLAAIASGLTGLASANFLPAVAQWLELRGSVVFMPAFLLMIASLMVMSIIGLMGRDLDDGKREWWSRVGAVFAILAGCWTLISAIALYVPDLLSGIGGLKGAAAVAASWLSTAFGAYQVAARLTSRGETKDSSGDWLLTIGSIVSGIFILGTLCLVAIMNSKVIQAVGLLEASLVTAILATVFGWRFDVNEFSMNHFYRNRLVRCYMGAARQYLNRPGRPVRVPDAFTGLDFNDDFGIDTLAPWGNYPGPFHIVNTSLNLARPNDLAMQDRKADSFSITPHYCGSPKTGYRLASGYIYSKRAIKLGTAVAISGAAASPNMGSLTSPALAFVMTLFNVRLGWWVPHPDPAHAPAGTPASPQYALVYLLKELFAATTERDEYLNLSDGGHFENLGAYELIRRRCQLVVIGDGGADPDYHMDDLGNLIRLCRLDFNTEIVLDPILISRREGKFGKAHCAVGKILYPEGSIGTIVYMKSSLCGDESPDVLHYATKAPDFPHETTADQFFSEEQFESYRALGEHIARETFEKAIKDWRITEDGEQTNQHSIENLNRALRLTWFAPARQAANFTRHTDALERVWESLRSNRRLAFLDAQLFPSWPDLTQGSWPRSRVNQWLPRGERELREAFYVCQSILQLMENVYVDVDLEREHNHPDNRGWMNLFRHWSGSSMLRVAWALSCQTYGARFQSFLRREVGFSNEDGMEFKKIESSECNPVEKIEVGRVRQMTPNAADACLLGIYINVRTPLHDTPFQFRVGLLLVTEPVCAEKPADSRPGILHWVRVQAQLQNMGLGTSAVERYRQSLKPAELVRDPNLAHARIAAMLAPYGELNSNTVPPASTKSVPAPSPLPPAT
jgi:hypothetical protein